MENEPVLMGCIADERDSFHMHTRLHACVRDSKWTAGMCVGRHMDLCSHLYFSYNLLINPAIMRHQLFLHEKNKCWMLLNILRPATLKNVFQHIAL